MTYFRPLSGLLFFLLLFSGVATAQEDGSDESGPDETKTERRPALQVGCGRGMADLLRERLSEELTSDFEDYEVLPVQHAAHPVGDLVLNAESGAPLGSSDWAFTGSLIVQTERFDEETETWKKAKAFGADLTQTLIALYRDPLAILVKRLQEGKAFESGGKIVRPEVVWAANANILPPRWTEARIVLTPVEDETKKKDESQEEKPKPIQLPGIHVDTSERRITVDGWICLQRGYLELLACTRRGKKHESLLIFDCKPKHLKVALIALGLTEKPLKKESFGQEGEIEAADDVRIRVEWDEFRIVWPRGKRGERERALVFLRKLAGTEKYAETMPFTVAPIEVE